MMTGVLVMMRARFLRLAEREHAKQEVRWGRRRVRTRRATADLSGPALAASRRWSRLPRAELTTGRLAAIARPLCGVGAARPTGPTYGRALKHGRQHLKEKPQQGSEHGRRRGVEQQGRARARATRRAVEARVSAGAGFAGGGGGRAGGARVLSAAINRQAAPTTEVV